MEVRLKEDGKVNFECIQDGGLFTYGKWFCVKSQALCRSNNAMRLDNTDQGSVAQFGTHEQVTPVEGYFQEI